jgi:hypothetical protein
VRRSYKDIEDNASAKQIIGIIKSSDPKYKEKSKYKKRLHPDKPASNFKAYQPLQPSQKKIIKPHFFKFDNIPIDPNEKMPTPKFAQSYDDKFPRYDYFSYQYESTKNIVSPLGTPFPCISPTAIVSARNCAYPVNGMILYSPSCEALRPRSPMTAWDDDEMKINSTRDMTTLDMAPFFNAGLISATCNGEPAEIKKPTPLSPNKSVV